ncbi:MAG: phosphoribosylanthranilate isomerase [Anaerolineae bacterium]|nr:phosphoribosylanthranilate isomerase [Anaerolineae bacterium]
MTRVKICGITTLEDALLAAEAGADMLGFVFYRNSPRFITPDACRGITDVLRERLGRACPLLIGVFANEPNVVSILFRAGLDYAQLHGEENVAALAALEGRAYKTIRPRNRNEAWAMAEAFEPYAPLDDRVPSVLVEAFHVDRSGNAREPIATGIALAVKEQVPRMMLAGGLNVENVGERIRAIRPWGVDVTGGIEGETTGRKDRISLLAFLTAVKIADAAG